MTAVANLFERLNQGRPPRTRETVKRPRRGDDQKTLLLDFLANGPVPATMVEERGTAHGSPRNKSIPPGSK
jgi:hypothetical protein